MSTPVVLVSGAMAIHSGFYKPLVAEFVDHGWHAVTVAQRGFDRGLPVAARGSDWTYRDLIDDVEAAVIDARATYPNRPVILMGHSLGAQVGLGHQNVHSAVDGLVSVGASIPHFGFYPHGGAYLMALGVLVPLSSRVFGYVRKPLFGAPGASTMMREWARMVRTGIPPFPIAEPVATRGLVIELEHDTLAVADANTEFTKYLDPSSTTRWLYRADATPEGGNTDHVLWARTPSVVVDEVVSWWDSGPSSANDSTGGHEHIKLRSPKA